MFGNFWSRLGASQTPSVIGISDLFPLEDDWTLIEDGGGGGGGGEAETATTSIETTEAALQRIKQEAAAYVDESRALMASRASTTTVSWPSLARKSYFPSSVETQHGARMESYVSQLWQMECERQKFLGPAFSPALTARFEVVPFLEIKAGPPPPPPPPARRAKHRWPKRQPPRTPTTVERAEPSRLLHAQPATPPFVPLRRLYAWNSSRHFSRHVSRRTFNTQHAK